MRHCLQVASKHISESDTYRYWSLYSVLLFVFKTWGVDRWPIDRLWVWALVETPWVFALSQAIFPAAMTLVALLALVSLFRRSWVSKVLGGVSLSLVLWSIGFNPFAAGIDVLVFAFSIPLSLLAGVAMGNEAVEAPLYALYLGLIWLLVRPFVRRLVRPLSGLGLRVIGRWPISRVLARPLL